MIRGRDGQFWRSHLTHNQVGEYNYYSNNIKKKTTPQILMNPYLIFVFGYVEVLDVGSNIGDARHRQTGQYLSKCSMLWEMLSCGVCIDDKPCVIKYDGCPYKRWCKDGVERANGVLNDDERRATFRGQIIQGHREGQLGLRQYFKQRLMAFL